MEVCLQSQNIIHIKNVQGNGHIRFIFIRVFIENLFARCSHVIMWQYIQHINVNNSTRRCQRLGTCSQRDRSCPHTICRTESVATRPSSRRMAHDRCCISDGKRRWTGLKGRIRAQVRDWEDSQEKFLETWQQKGWSTEFLKKIVLPIVCPKIGRVNGCLNGCSPSSVLRATYIPD